EIIQVCHIRLWLWRNPLQQNIVLVFSCAGTACATRAFWRHFRLRHFRLLQMLSAHSEDCMHGLLRREISCNAELAPCLRIVQPQNSPSGPQISDNDYWGNVHATQACGDCLKASLRLLLQEERPRLILHWFSKLKVNNPVLAQDRW